MLQPRPLLLALIASLVAASSAHAQIVRDDSAGAGRGAPVIVSPGPDGNLNEYVIPDTLGVTRGANLIHSFRDFNLAAGEVATFRGPDTIRNIITRVTGGSPSSIDGTLHSEIAGSSFYFLNPAGILFGPNASLDVPGSFFASTAAQLQLADGSRLDTGSSGPIPVLLTAPPADFGFLDPQAPIRINGSSLFPLGDLGLAGRGLRVEGAFLSAIADGEAGAVIGSARLSAGSGELTILGSTINSAERIELDGSAVLIERSSLFSILDLLSIDAKGTRTAGSADDMLLPGDLWILDNSQLISGVGFALHGERLLLSRSLIETEQGPGVDPALGRRVDLEFSDSVTIRGLKLENSAIQYGGIYARASEDSGALVRIRTPRLVLEEQGVIASGAYVPLFFDPRDAGRSGIIDIAAHEVILRSGGRIDASSVSRSSAGEVRIRARDFIDLSGEGTGIFSITGLDGDGGKITLNAPRVTLGDGAQVSAETTTDLAFADRPFADRRACDSPSSCELNDLELAGIPRGAGNAGDISISADTIALETGARISSTTSGSGDGGTIRLEAQRLLSVTGGASITADSTGTGEAGTIELVSGDTLRLEDALVATRSSISSGGDIRFQAKLLDVNRSTISTNVGAGSGGNVDIAAQTFVLRDSTIVARAKEGTGGNINIAAKAFVRTPDSVIDASADVGIDGSVEIRPPVVDLNASLARLESGYVDPASLLVERCQLRDREDAGSFRLGGRESLPESPDRSPAARYSAVPATPGPADRGDVEAFLRAGQPAAERSADEQIRTAEVLEALGELSRARSALDAALERTDGSQRGSLLALRGRLWARSGVSANAERDFAAAERLAEEHGDAGLLAHTLLDRANAEAEAGRAGRADELLARAQVSARRAGDRDTLARSRAAAARSDAELLSAANELAGLPATHDRLLSEIHIARALAALPGDAARIRAGELLARSAARAEDLDDPAAEAYAWGHLGDLYTRERRSDEALELARRALAAAARADRPEAVFRFAGELGDTLRAAGDLAGAGQSYALAVGALERLRSGVAPTARAQAELAAAFPAQHVTSGLVDVLLQQAQQTTAAEPRAALLRQARDVLESSGRREIRDFFQDECIALEQTTVLDALGDALVVYPVFLDDRAELIVSRAEGIDQVRVPVPVARLRAEIEAFRALAEDRSTHDYRAPAAHLYDWLVAPLAPYLERGANGRTLVFVARGPLAGVPLAALYDRAHSQFLIEQMPVAVSPGVSLIAPRALGGGPHTALQAGLTEAVEGQEALAAAGSEIEAIHQLVGGKVLTDTQFVAPTLDHELGTVPYEMVHIASHGHFGARPEDAYLLAFDGRLGMSELADLVSRTRFRDRPLELLTLSACETAAGDERAALGLAGVAVRAGARSTLASLWSVNDSSTARLMEAFYGHLVRDGASRAAALQRAQRELLADPVYRHPAYWSPFVLVGSWR